MILPILDIEMFIAPSYSKNHTQMPTHIPIIGTTLISRGCKGQTSYGLEASAIFGMGVL